MTAIDRWLNHDSSLIREMAQNAVRYKALLDQGRVSRKEYDSLCRQSLIVEGIDKAASDAELRRQMQEAVAALRVFLGVVL